jgi:hypothetical protein
MQEMGVGGVLCLRFIVHMNGSKHTMVGKFEALVQVKKRLDLEMHAFRTVNFSRVVVDPSMWVRMEALQVQMREFDQTVAVIDGFDLHQCRYTS